MQWLLLPFTIPYGIIYFIIVGIGGTLKVILRNWGIIPW